MEEETNEPITIESQLAKIEKELDEYESKLGLPSYNVPEDFQIGKYIYMPQEQREKLTSEECCSAASLLESMAFHINRALNREKAIVKYIQHVLNRMVARTAGNFYGSWDSQRYQAIENDSAATKLNNIMNEREQRIERLSYTSNSLKSIAASYINIQRIKVKHV